jgi:RNA polymerase sigma-70 factor, ECF subfamily
MQGRIAEDNWSSGTEVGLDQLGFVYAFIYSRVGNRADAEDLTQEVALKALHKLSEGAPLPAIRGYLFKTARSVLANFWSRRFRIPESALLEDLSLEPTGQELLPSPGIAARVARIFDGLSPTHRKLLEMRFLRGYSVKEIAAEMGKSVGSVKLMQLRALRSAAARD